jgi:hypothetical protein
VYFDHTIPIDYEDYVTDLLARDLSKSNLEIKLMNGPSSEVPELADMKNVTDYMWYRIDITEAATKALESKETTVILETAEYFKRRRLPFPRRISMKDKQNLEMYDSKYFLTPYFVEKQVTTYLLEKHRILAYSEDTKVKAVDQGIRYGPYDDVEALTFNQIRVSFTYEEPLIILNEARRSVEISHWGNIAVEEYFDMSNIGGDLLGEYNRVDSD